MCVRVCVRVRAYVSECVCACARARARACVCVCVCKGTSSIQTEGYSQSPHATNDVIARSVMPYKRVTDVASRFVCGRAL